MGGAVASGARAANRGLPRLDANAGDLGEALIVFGIIALAWTVTMVWGAVLAISGRSRVMLLVGGSIAVASPCSGSWAAWAPHTSGGGGVVFNVLVFLARWRSSCCCC